MSVLSVWIWESLLNQDSPAHESAGCQVSMNYQSPSNYKTPIGLSECLMAESRWWPSSVAAPKNQTKLPSRTVCQKRF